MPDETARSRLDLLTRLHNSPSESGAVRDAVYSILGGYAGIHVTDGDTAQSGIGTDPETLTGWTANGSLADGATPDYENSRIVLSSPGVWILLFQCGFSGTAAAIFDFHATLDGTEIEGAGTRRKLNAAGDVGSASFFSEPFEYASGAAGIVLVTVHAAASPPTKSLTPQNATLLAVRIG